MIKKKKIGLAHGVFDVLHSGHLMHFEECKKHCDFLIVSITDDKYVNKGPNRPFFNSSERFRFLKSIKFIDKVLINKDFTPIKLINKIKPDYYFKGKDYTNLLEDYTGNIIKEKKTVEKNGGRLFITNTKLKSSSSIINKDFNRLDKDLKDCLNLINKNSIKKFFENYRGLKNDKKILIFGEPIVDKYTYVETLGKSLKNQIISTKYKYQKVFGGGTILVNSLFNKFFNKVDFLCVNNNYNNYFYKKFLNKKTKKIFIKDLNAKITIKNRFVNYYRGERLFQINQNDDQSLSEKGETKLINLFKKIIKKYHKIVLFDFGHGLISKGILKFINKNKHKFFINCQSNSSNFGFNIAKKYNGGDTICVDEMEFRLCVGDRTSLVSDLIDKNIKFINKFNSFIITMGKQGCYYVHNKKKYFVPVVYKFARDTTGAGDIFFSTLTSLSIISNLGIKEKILLSHIAAGIYFTEGSKQLNDWGSNFSNINIAVIEKIYLNLIK